MSESLRRPRRSRPLDNGSLALAGRVHPEAARFYSLDELTRVRYESLTGRMCHNFSHPNPRLPGHSCSTRSEEHTSELQSRGHLVCRLLLEKKNDDRAQATR